MYVPDQALGETKKGAVGAGEIDAQSAQLGQHVAPWAQAPLICHVNDGAAYKCHWTDDVCGGASNSHGSPPGNSWLHDNQLTSLDVGIFDKNTALRNMYVDRLKGIFWARSKGEEVLRQRLYA
jgi:hypothetical protein